MTQPSSTVVACTLSGVLIVAFGTVNTQSETGFTPIEVLNISCSGRTTPPWALLAINGVCPPALILPNSVVSSSIDAGGVVIPNWLASFLL